MKKINELTFTEKNDFAHLITPWLSNWTDECKVKVMNQAERIINDETLLAMFKAYNEAEEREMAQLACTLSCYMDDDSLGIRTFRDSQHYSKVLYDFLIK